VVAIFAHCWPVFEFGLEGNVSMSKEENFIFPVHGELLQRNEKEQLLRQRAICIWMTGLSGSGKTSIAKILERKLHAEKILTVMLDGDNIRDGINRNLGFTEADRKENIRRIAEINKLFINTGVVTLNCFVSPTAEIRALASGIIGQTDFIEVFVDTPLDVCEARDVKGLYAKARAGELKNFTGIDAPFEPPLEPAISIRTAEKSAEDSAQELFEFVIRKIKSVL
jgi:adenylylsulfate kinase